MEDAIEAAKNPIFSFPQQRRLRVHQSSGVISDLFEVVYALIRESKPVFSPGILLFSRKQREKKEEKTTFLF
jgi:hypothetical protein